MSFFQTRNRSTQSLKVARRVAGMSDCLLKSLLGAAKNLTSLKLGLALFMERADAFQAVVRVEAIHLHLHFMVERAHQVIFVAMENGLFYGADGKLRPFSDFLGKSGDRGLELVRRVEMIDDPQAVRSGGVNHFPGVEHFRSDRWANELRQEVGSAVIGEQSDFGEILPESRTLHGEADV